MNNVDDLFMIEVALRDARHLGVIMALDRLVILPASEQEMKNAMDDMKTVRDFIYKHLPKTLQPAARAMFVEHGKAIENNFRSLKAREH